MQRTSQKCLSLPGSTLTATEMYTAVGEKRKSNIKNKIQVCFQGMRLLFRSMPGYMLTVTVLYIGYCTYIYYIKSLYIFTT
jgi:hypothetical protein